MAQSRPTVEVLTDAGLKQAADDVEARIAQMKRLVPLLAACRDDLRRGNYLRWIADRFQTDERDLLAAMKAHQSKDHPGRGRERSGAERGEESDKPRVRLHADEEMCILLLLRYPHLIARAREAAITGELASVPARELFARLLEADAEDSPAPFLSSIEDEELRGRLSGRLLDDAALPKDKANALLADCVRNMRRRHLRNELGRLTGDILRRRVRRRAGLCTLFPRHLRVHWPGGLASRAGDGYDYAPHR